MTAGNVEAHCLASGIHVSSSPAPGTTRMPGTSSAKTRGASGRASRGPVGASRPAMTNAPAPQGGQRCASRRTHHLSAVDPQWWARFSFADARRSLKLIALWSAMTFLRTSSRSILLFEHDLRANALRLSRGKTGTHFALTRPFGSGSCSSSIAPAPSSVHLAAAGCRKFAPLRTNLSAVRFGLSRGRSRPSFPWPRSIGFHPARILRRCLLRSKGADGAGRGYGKCVETQWWRIDHVGLGNSKWIGQS
jgi:hypothetical protein